MAETDADELMDRIEDTAGVFDEEIRSDFFKASCDDDEELLNHMEVYRPQLAADLRACLDDPILYA